jgi:hypothetical protein
VAEVNIRGPDEIRIRTFILRREMCFLLHHGPTAASDGRPEESKTHVWEEQEENAVVSGIRILRACPRGGARSRAGVRHSVTDCLTPAGGSVAPAGSAVQPKGDGRKLRMDLELCEDTLDMGPSSRVSDAQTLGH